MVPHLLRHVTAIFSNIYFILDEDNQIKWSFFINFLEPLAPSLTHLLTHMHMSDIQHCFNSIQVLASVATYDFCVVHLTTTTCVI